MKPFIGTENDAPSDGAVLRPVKKTKRGVTVTHGVCPRFGDADAYDMAMCGVDEAYRAHIAIGGDPEVTSALDNFCWPDPVESPENPDGKYRMAQLVRACKGLKEACVAYGMPLISGKDSMKNESNIGGKKIPVRPTLLISQMGIIEDVTKAVGSDFKQPGDIIYILGETRGELGGSFLEKITAGSDVNFNLGRCPSVNTTEALELYRKLHKSMKAGLVKSCHDLSDGGLAAAAAESAIGGRLGAEIKLDTLPADSSDYESSRLLFAETPSRFIVTVSPENKTDFEKALAGTKTAETGIVTGGKTLEIYNDNEICLQCSIDDITAAWKSFK
jgi:phosphoribosylformylglycinamidine synthase